MTKLEMLKEYLKASIEYYNKLYNRARAEKRNEKLKLYSRMSELKNIEALLSEDEETIKNYIDFLKRLKEEI